MTLSLLGKVVAQLIHPRKAPGASQARSQAGPQPASMTGMPVQSGIFSWPFGRSGDSITERGIGKHLP